MDCSSLTPTKITFDWVGSMASVVGLIMAEVGALDGVQFSNSSVFNRALDWKGLLLLLLWSGSVDPSIMKI
jgi:hypothetical protein